MSSSEMAGDEMAAASVAYGRTDRLEGRVGIPTWYSSKVDLDLVNGRRLGADGEVPLPLALELELGSCLIHDVVSPNSLKPLALLPASRSTACNVVLSLSPAAVKAFSLALRLTGSSMMVTVFWYGGRNEMDSRRVLRRVEFESSVLLLLPIPAAGSAEECCNEANALAWPCTSQRA